MSLYLPGLSLLLAGDLFAYEANRIAPSADLLATDPGLLRESVRAAVALPVEAFVGYHGGWLRAGAGRLLGELA